MKFRFNLMEWVLSLTTILNYGFINIVLPILIPIPLFYFVVFGYIILNTKNTCFYSFFKQKFFILLLPLILIWFFHFILALNSFNAYIIRDGTVVLDLIFFLLGWIYISKINFYDLRLEFFIRTIFIINTFYFALYPFQQFIRSISVSFGAFTPVSLFGHFRVSGIIALVAIYYFWNSKKLFEKTLVLINIAMLFLIQSRALFFVLFLILPVFIYYFDVYKKQNSKFIKFVFFKRLSLILFFGILFLSVISIFDISITGRHGDLSFNLIVNEFKSMVGKGELEGPAGGFNQRLDWLDTLFKEQFSDVSLFLYGRGVGMPLTDFVDPRGMVVREPHNSVLTIFFRFGFIGFMSFLLVNIYFIKRILKLINLEKRIFVTLFFLYFVILFNGLFQPSLEYSYFAALFYFIIGLVLHYYIHWKKENENTPNAQ